LLVIQRSAPGSTTWNTTSSCNPSRRSERSHGAAGEIEPRQTAAGSADPDAAAIGVRGEAEDAVALETAAALAICVARASCPSLTRQSPAPSVPTSRLPSGSKQERPELAIVELRDARCFSVAHVRESRGRADPQTSVRRLDERAHAIVRQSGVRCTSSVSTNFPSRKRDHAAAVRADPQAAVATFGQRIDVSCGNPSLFVRHRIGAGKSCRVRRLRCRPRAARRGLRGSRGSPSTGSPSLRVNDRNRVSLRRTSAARRADPQRSFAILDHRADDGTRKPFRDAERFRADAAPAREAAVGADPQTAVASRCSVRIRSLGKPVARRQVRTIAPSRHAARPPPSVPIHSVPSASRSKRARKIVRQTFARRDPLLHARVAPAHDAAAVRGDPQTARAVVFHGPDPIDRQPVARREARDLLAVDAQQIRRRPLP
jgi:hypothetical protein